MADDVGVDLCRTGESHRTASDSLDDIARRCKRDLHAAGVSIVDGLFGDNGEIAACLRLLVMELFDSGRMRPGVAGKGIWKDQRNDFVCWITPDGAVEDASGGNRTLINDSHHDDIDDSPYFELARRVSRLVRCSVDAALRPSLLMASVYPPCCRARFRAHIDSVGKDQRVLTAVYYLNRKWSRDHGALLRLWTSGAEDRGRLVEVPPEADRLVLFFSKHVRHEVTLHEGSACSPDGHRCAITIWFFLGDQRTTKKRKSAKDRSA